MNLFFLVSLVLKRICIVDVAWSLGFLLVALLSFFSSSGNLPQILLLGIVLVWSMRLALYLLSRIWGHAEDWRYAELKRGWGSQWILQSYFKVFLLQGTLLLLCSSTLWYGMEQLSDQLSLLNGLGFLLSLMGLSLETYSDYYMKKFKNNISNAGMFCQSGPWKYCRFPNYLGEIIFWWGVFIFVLNEATWWTFISPLALNLLIIKFSGIPFLERRLKAKKGYVEYSKRVPRLLLKKTCE